MCLMNKNNDYSNFRGSILDIFYDINVSPYRNNLMKNASTDEWFDKFEEIYISSIEVLNESLAR